MALCRIATDRNNDAQPILFLCDRYWFLTVAADPARSPLHPREPRAHCPQLQCLAQGLIWDHWSRFLNQDSIGGKIP